MDKKVQSRVSGISPRLLCAFLIPFALVSCVSQQDEDSLGTKVLAYSGNNQYVYPGYPSQSALVAKVVAPDGTTPMPGVGVIFGDVSTPGNTGTHISTPSGVTDSNGEVSTFITAPNIANASIQIEAQVAGSSASTVFDISTYGTQLGNQYQVISQHNGVETAGVGFTFTVNVVNSGAQSAPIVTGYNGLTHLTFAFHTSDSWFGNPPQNTENQTIDCTFAAGVCSGQLPSNFILADSLATTTVVVGDTTGTNAPGSETIQVVHGSAAGLGIATAAGGPSANPSPTPFLQTAITTLSAVPGTPLQLYGAVTDSSGNYISDAVSANSTWSASGASIVNALGATIATGSPVTFTPSLAGAGTLSFVDSDVSSAVGSNSITIAPGPPAKLLVKTQHNDSETAGVPFYVTATVQDAKGNAVTSLSGQQNTSYSLAVQGVLPYHLSGGCARFYELNTTFSNPFGSASCSPGTTTTGFMTNEIYVSGVMTSNMEFILPQAQGSGSTPQLTVTTKDTSVTPNITITGTDTSIAVAAGQPDHVNIYGAMPPAASDPDPLCSQDMIGSDSTTCPINNAHGTSATLYAVVEDKGGNVLTVGGLQAQTATWQGLDAWASGSATYVTGTDGSGSADVTFTPNVAGLGAVLVTVTTAGVSCNSSPCSTLYYGNTP